MPVAPAIGGSSVPEIHDVCRPTGVSVHDQHGRDGLETVLLVPATDGFVP